MLRKITSIRNAANTRVATLYRNPEYNEYQIKFYTLGVYMVNADYFTDDKSDATSTAEYFTRETSVSDLSTAC